LAVTFRESLLGQQHEPNSNCSAMKFPNVNIILLLTLVAPLGAQQVINGSRTLLGNWDVSGAATTKPLKAGTVIPATCGVGEMFFKTDATAGANVYLCTATNTWTQIAGGAGGGPLTSVFGRTGVVAAQTGDYTFSQVSGQAVAGQLPASVQYYQSGAGAPAGSCTAGQNGYLDTTNLDYWFCDVANTWKKTLSTTNSGAFTLTGQTGAVPATPAAGLTTLYLNSTDKTLHSVNDAGIDLQYAGLGEANTWGGFLQDFSASTIKIPIAAGFTTVTNGGLGYDSTANQLHAAISGVDAIIPTRASAAPATGNCVKWGSNLQLQDSGAVCGVGGGAGTVNSGTASHLAYYATTGTGVSDMGADFTFSTHTLAGGATAVVDLSAAPAAIGLRVPSAPGAAPTVDGQLAMDTTSHHLKVGSSGSTIDLQAGGGGSAPPINPLAWSIWGNSYSSGSFGVNATTNRGHSQAFWVPSPGVTSTSVKFTVGVASGTCGGTCGSQVAIYVDGALTSPVCLSIVGTSGASGLLNINAVGIRALTWSSGSGVSGGVCTLASGSYILVMSSDSTVLALANYGSIVGFQQMSDTAGGTTLFYRFGDATSAVSTGTGASLAISADISAVTWSQASGAVQFTLSR